MSKKSKNIYLVDGHSLCYRAYYAIRELSTSKGMPTNAIYGFLNILRKLIREYQPDMLAVAFDVKGPTVRHKKYKEYKVHRPVMPDDLISQIPRIKELVEAYRIPVCEKEGYEADDIIATLTKEAKKKGFLVTIVTGDKDALQLVDEKTKVLSPHPMGDKLYDAKSVEEKYGVSPSKMVDLMALIGDTTDNIPGVKGIGKVTAAKLIQEYGSLKGVYENVDRIASEATKKKLIEGKEMAELSRQLAQLDMEVDVDMDIDEAHLGEADTDRLKELFKEFEFQKLLKEISTIEREETKYAVKKKPKEVEEAVKEMSRGKKVSMSVSFADSDINGIAFSCDERLAYFIPMNKELLPIIKGVLEDDTLQKRGHDIKNDILALRKRGIDIKGVSFDVMIADYLIDPSRGKYDLESIAMRQLGYSLSEDTGAVGWGASGQAEMDFSGVKEALHACERSDIIERLYNVLEPQLDEKHLKPLFRDVEMPLAGILADMEAEGVGIDIKYLETRSKAMEKELEEISSRIYKLAGEEFNINSPKQLQVILYEKLGLAVTKKTKTGASTDESVLRRLTEVHELPAVLLEYREISKLKSTYYDSILNLVDEGTHTLHAHFNQAVTATGRLSSSEPNLQNIPIKTKLGKEVRRAFIPGGKGMVLLAADYSQVELRILAHLADDKRLISAFKKGEDVHRSTASEIYGCKLAEVTDKMRSVAKTVNFGIAYGMSAFGLAKDLGISAEEAQGFIDAYFKRYSGVKSFITKTIASARKKGFVTTLLKRRRYIPEINASNEHVKGFAERVAVNTPVQGSAADLIKLAMIACDKEFKASGVKTIIQVHDELVFKLPLEMLEEASEKVKRLMEGVIELKVPLKVDVEAGRNWLDLEEVAL